MPGMTAGEFTEAIGRIADSLNALADGLSTCNLEVDIDGTEGRKVICQLPVIGGSDCRLRTLKEPRVADLHEAVEALAAWAADIKASLASHSPTEPLFAPPGPDVIENA